MKASSEMKAVYLVDIALGSGGLEILTNSQPKEASLALPLKGLDYAESTLLVFSLDILS
jgi:hypothetical protein